MSERTWRGRWPSTAKGAGAALVLGAGLLSASGCGPAGGAEEPPGPDAPLAAAPGVQPLRGDWVLREYVVTLERTRDPEQALRAIDSSVPVLLRIEDSVEGERWLAVLNFHEGVEAVVEAREAAGEGELVTFSHPFDWPLLAGEHRITLRDGLLHWRVATGGKVWEWQLRRVEPSLEVWASRVVLGGTFRDAAGRLYEFGDDGTLVRDRQALRYRVSLDPEGVGCPYLQLEPESPEGGRPAVFGLRREGARLHLYDAGSQEDPTISCEGTPLIVLTPVPVNDGHE